jgi:hypothetical protein
VSAGTRRGRTGGYIPRPMSRRLLRMLAAAVLALALVTSLGACSKKRDFPIREGLGLEVNGLKYTVFITRELNLRDPEDKSYFKGPEAPPGSAYYGVFLQVCNEGSKPLPAAADFTVVDTQGDHFQPVPLPATNDYRYKPDIVAPHRCLPTLGSMAQIGPTSGSLLLFKIPNAAVENRPLDLQIGASGTQNVGEKQRVELDI